MKRSALPWLLFVSMSLSLPLVSLLDAQETDSGKKGKGPAPKFRFVHTNRPSLRFGDWGRVDFRVKFQHDFRAFDPEFTGDEGDTSNLRRFRLAIEGYVTRDFEYEIERELRNEVGDAFGLRTRPTGMLWRDVFGNWRKFRRVQVRVGQQKIPFGLDQINGITNGEFAFRSLSGQSLSPGRDLGVVLHGRPLDQRIDYQVGLFKNDGWRAHLADDSRSGQRTFAGRVVVLPLKFLPAAKWKTFQDMELGVAFTESPLTEGLRSLHGRTWVVTQSYFDRIFVRGHRLRLGGEFHWEPGPFSLKGEMIRVRDQRLGQGIRGQDLPDLISRGWYVSTSWLITGEKKADVTPKRPLGWGIGTGAIELAARVEQIRFGSAEHIGTPSRSPRAVNLFSTSERAATFGVNWYLNRWMRITYNGVREQIEDVQNTPIRGRDVYWGHYVRMQFVL
jgi:phosphate-selective porin OprO and OprP